jgi:hypothetical protein
MVAGLAPMGLQPRQANGEGTQPSEGKLQAAAYYVARNQTKIVPPVVVQAAHARTRRTRPLCFWKLSVFYPGRPEHCAKSSKAQSFWLLSVARVAESPWGALEAVARSVLGAAGCTRQLYRAQ